MIDALSFWIGLASGGTVAAFAAWLLTVRFYTKRDAVQVVEVEERPPRSRR